MVILDDRFVIFGGLRQLMALVPMRGRFGTGGVEDWRDSQNYQPGGQSLNIFIALFILILRLRQVAGMFF